MSKVAVGDLSVTKAWMSVAAVDKRRGSKFCCVGNTD